MLQHQNADKHQRRVPGPQLTLATLINMQKQTFRQVIVEATATTQLFSDLTKRNHQ